MGDPTGTIAKANGQGRMKCAWCRETFGPAQSFAQRLELEDNWQDHVVAAQHAKVLAHVKREHPQQAAECGRRQH